MLRTLIATWIQEGSACRPLLGRWCHVAYNASCDPMRKAELNTNDHGVVLTHTDDTDGWSATTPSPAPPQASDNTDPWDHPTWITVASGFGM